MTSHADASDFPQGNSPTQQSSRPLVVGLGASAGGLDALNRLLEHLPPVTGMAFVVIQHLDPAHESALAELLSRHTPIPVTQVETDMPVERDNVYVIAPNTVLSIQGGTLRPATREDVQGRRNVIDTFFESLAEDQDGYAVGIILSGTGSDGTLGLRAIKESGGMTIAQDPSTAAYDSMPRSAIMSGFVDYALPLEMIAGRLVEHFEHLRNSGAWLQGVAASRLLKNPVV